MLRALWKGFDPFSKADEIKDAFKKPITQAQSKLDKAMLTLKNNPQKQMAGFEAQQAQDELNNLITWSVICLRRQMRPF